MHEDGMGFGGGLWAARDLPSTITDEVTGLEVRVFDRAALAGLSMITSNATKTVRLRKSSLQSRPNQVLKTQKQHARGSRRNLVNCLRVRSLDEEPIELLFLEGTAAATAAIRRWCELPAIRLASSALLHQA